MISLQPYLSADLLTLGMAADQARRSGSFGDVVTYLRVHVASSAYEESETAAVPETASEVRCYEAPSSLEAAVALVQRLRERASTRRLTAFSMAHIEAGEWGGADEALQALAKAGLDDLAEIPVDQLIDLERSLGMLQTAGFAPRRLTVREPIGGRVLDVIAAVQKALPAASTVRRFAPLPRVAPTDKPTTGYEDVRTVALARLGLGDLSIEVDWSLYGPKLAQVALTFGADHLDAVAATSDSALGPRRSIVEDIERNIRAAASRPEEFRWDR